MKKKFLLSFMLMCISIFAFGMLSVSAYQGTRSGDYLYYEESNGEITITDCDADATEVVIPKEINGKSVTKIGNAAFGKCDYLIKITLPNSVTEIGDNAFDGCNYLTDIVLGDNITKIGNGAFRYCNIIELKIPNKVTSIGDYAFCGNNRLTTITIPDSVISIGCYAFKNCEKLSKVNITDIVAWCNIMFGSEHSGQFEYAPTSNPLYYAKKLYLNGEMLTDLIVPSSVTEIKDNAFYNCTGLKSVIFLDGVTTIGNYAFYNCSGLKSITMPDSVVKIGTRTFLKCSNVTNIVISDNLKVIGALAFCDCGGSVNIKIPKGATQISDNAFYGFEGLVSIVIPDSVKSIGSQAFSGCTNLEEIILPDSMENIGSYAFSNCTNLLKIVIPDGITTINEGTFNECKYLNSVTIPSSVIKIDKFAFDGCHYLKEVNITDISAWCSINFVQGYVSGHDSDSSNPLYNAGKLYLNGKQITNLIIPEGVRKICDYAFGNLKSITAVTIPKSVLSIGQLAFLGCNNISTVYYDGTEDYWNNIMSIGWGNDVIKNATRKLGYEIKLISEGEDATTLICWPNTKIKLSDIEKKYMHKVTLYTDEAMKTEFDTGVAITNNMTLYVQLGEEITYTVGDLNGDDKVTDDDVIYLMYHIFFADDYPVEQDCDFNNDGVVTDDDVTYLMYHIFFPEEYPIN